MGSGILSAGGYRGCELSARAADWGGWSCRFGAGRGKSEGVGICMGCHSCESDWEWKKEAELDFRGAPGGSNSPFEGDLAEDQKLMKGEVRPILHTVLVSWSVAEKGALPPVFILKTVQASTRTERTGHATKPPEE